MTEKGKTGSEAVQGDGALMDIQLIERLRVRARVRAADCGQKSMTARLTAVIDLVAS